MSVDLLSATVMDRVPGWAGRQRTVAPLSGGITNRNYRVEVDGDAFVVRIPAESGSLLGIDRGLEHQASRLAAACGVGPEVIAFVEPEGVLVTRFIEGRPVTDEAVHEPVMLERIAQSLRRIHQAGSIAAGFSPFRVVEAYALVATRHGGQLPAAHERARPRPPARSTGPARGRPRLGFFSSAPQIVARRGYSPQQIAREIRCGYRPERVWDLTRSAK